MFWGIMDLFTCGKIVVRTLLNLKKKNKEKRVTLLLKEWSSGYAEFSSHSPTYGVYSNNGIYYNASLTTSFIDPIDDDDSHLPIQPIYKVIILI